MEITHPHHYFFRTTKRSTWLPLLRGAGLWYYDFGVQKGFGWWDNPRYLETVEQIKN